MKTNRHKKALYILAIICIFAIIFAATNMLNNQTILNLAPENMNDSNGLIADNTETIKADVLAKYLCQERGFVK